MPESMRVEWGQGCQGFKGKPRKTFRTEMLKLNEGKQMRLEKWCAK